MLLGLDTDESSTEMVARRLGETLKIMLIEIII